MLFGDTPLSCGQLLFLANFFPHLFLFSISPISSFLGYYFLDLSFLLFFFPVYFVDSTFFTYEICWFNIFLGDSTFFFTDLLSQHLVVQYFIINKRSYNFLFRVTVTASYLSSSAPPNSMPLNILPEELLLR